MKNVERIGKATDILIKVIEDLEDQDQVAEMINIVQRLSDVRKSCVGEFKKDIIVKKGAY